MEEALALRPTTHKHPAWLEVDLSNFRHNLACIRKKTQSKICCVTKANGYGHGLVPIAKAAIGFVDYFGVAHLAEGAQLRQAGIEIPILVLGAFHEDQIEDLIQHELEFTISSIYKAQLVAKLARGRKCRVHLEIDTGMRRTGVRIESALQLIDVVKSLDCFELVGVYSHFATSEEPNDATTFRQIEQFLALKKQVGKEGDSLIWHMANSGGICFYPDSWLDMVRPGLICYGTDLLGAMPELKPVMSLKAKISYFKVVAANEGISYSHLYKTSKQTRVITVPVGYGDGYRRDFTNRANVLVRNKRYCIAGRVCMDQFMIDIGEDEAYVGEEVILMGKQGAEEISLAELAKLSNTDPREILCHFNDRIPRIYVNLSQY